MVTVFMALKGVAVDNPGTLKAIVKTIVPHKFDGEIETALMQFKTGRATREQFWERMGVENWERAEEDLMKSFRTNPDLSEIIAYLKRKNYKVILLAEMPGSWVDIIVKHNNLKHYFDRAYSTSELKASKRQSAAYSKLADSYGDSIAIDTVEDNLRAASQVGMETILIGKTDGVFKPTHQVHSLKEVKEIL